MERDRERVRAELHRRILAGYTPHYDYQSCIDHWCDWFALSEEDFNRIYEHALVMRKKVLQEMKKSQQLRQAKVKFWKAMKYWIPILAAIVMTFFGYMLVHLAIPIERTRADIGYLQQEVDLLKRELRGVTETQDEIEKCTLKLEGTRKVDSIHFLEEIARVKLETGTIQNRLSNIEKENAKSQRDIACLHTDTGKLIVEIEAFRRELRGTRGEENKTAAGY